MPKVLAAISWLKAISLFGAIANSLNFISTKLLGVAEKSASVRHRGFPAALFQQYSSRRLLIFAICSKRGI
jgi:hypothetical protein